MTAETTKKTCLTWECPSCGRYGPSDLVVCYNTDNNEGVIVITTDDPFGDNCYERFDAAVERLWDLCLSNHAFRIPASYDMEALTCISCEEFEQYVDDLANGREASL
jgi:hypothetical protein